MSYNVALSVNNGTAVFPDLGVITLDTVTDILAYGLTAGRALGATSTSVAKNYVDFFGPDGAKLARLRVHNLETGEPA